MRRFALPIALAVVVLLAAGSYALTPPTPKSVTTSTTVKPTPQATQLAQPVTSRPATGGKPAEIAYDVHVGAKGVVANPHVYVVPQGDYVTFNLMATDLVEDDFVVDSYPDATSELDGGEVTKARFIAATPGQFTMRNANRKTVLGYLRVEAKTASAPAATTAN